jgi:hypothetical protein
MQGEQFTAGPAILARIPEWCDDAAEAFPAYYEMAKRCFAANDTKAAERWMDQNREALGLVMLVKNVHPDLMVRLFAEADDGRFPTGPTLSALMLKHLPAIEGAPEGMTPAEAAQMQARFVDVFRAKYLADTGRVPPGGSTERNRRRRDRKKRARPPLASK